MLLKVDVKAELAAKMPGVRLTDFGLKEMDLQKILFRSLDRLIPNDELLLVMQSRHWREEPDLMAIDAEGTLYIFELKAWESHPENILQALRYGQIYGQYGYEQLDHMFRPFYERDKSLLDVHRATFDVDLDRSRFNKKQVFVVMTNGIDHKTRAAIRYWRSQELDVQPWVYRVYKDADQQMLLEVSRFATVDDPYEDIQEGYYIHNTNYNNHPEDHEMMLRERVVAAFFSPPKQSVANLNRGDVVFLYRSRVGIVAVGAASGQLKKCAYHGNHEYADEDFRMPLTKFELVDPPITASEIKDVCGVDYSFRRTSFSIDAEAGKKLEAETRSRSKK